MNQLTKIEITGFKSIRSAALELRWLNVLIGANGAGKSNLASFLTLIGQLSRGSVQDYIAQEGGAHSLLYCGPKRTQDITAILNFKINTDSRMVHFRLMYGAPDRLVVSNETNKHGGHSVRYAAMEGEDQEESMMVDEAADGDPQARAARDLLQGIHVFQFHDTSKESRIRQIGYIDDSRHLRRDGGNLAAFLYRLQQTNEPCYHRIITTIQQVTPFFRDFELAPDARNPRSILLNWSERGSDYLLGPHQLSDGSLRAMSLITLLLQPEPELPDVIVIDEPELGLHPAALQVLASLVRSVSVHSQIILATQSVSLVNSFEPGDVVVVERGEDGTTFQRLDSERLREWLEEYTLGELWEKNVIGGRPSR